jgi:hypothetical protein
LVSTARTAALRVAGGDTQRPLRGGAPPDGGVVISRGPKAPRHRSRACTPCHRERPWHLLLVILFAGSCSRSRATSVQQCRTGYGGSLTPAEMDF